MLANYFDLKLKDSILYANSFDCNVSTTYLLIFMTFDFDTLN